MKCGVGRRGVSDPALLWLWCRPADTAPIQPLAWEFPYASGAALKRPKKKKKKKIAVLKLDPGGLWKPDNMISEAEGWGSGGNVLQLGLFFPYPRTLAPCKREA